ncbi:amino acid permease [Dinghuibacter silviterrae]|uniref:Amino acid/polyamine/organocation transporter (APC superfamily) n=1 Tax=Dinghuibacter silviterrae TaxID=1539049 RepID=A0A4V3GLS2_9BACT|nr:amino acid permease [Dinghuibacter silviterrae]TDX00643.1 amino acid/polyamine/organocation transporter (APC superfamily) [Dinghuibacter silviterrae]
MSLFVKKPLGQLLAQASDSHGLKRTLGPGNLVALGVGAIIGAGLFVRTAAASAEAAGPAVTISFVVAAIGCVFAGLCYAEFAAMIPIAGSAYTYAYATLGELIAWIIGWALIMEYALGATTVSISWSEYLNKLLADFGYQIPYKWCHSPFEHINTVVGSSVASFPADLAKTAKEGVLMLSDRQLTGLTPQLHSLVTTYHGLVNIPALFILLILSLLLIKGTAESALVNSIIVVIKVSIVLVFIALGWHFINPANHTPYVIPEGTPGHEGFFKHGIPGILGGASIVFFAFIGFDAVSTAAQEAKNPKKDMPKGILGSLIVCTILYILFSYVLTGVANWREFELQGKEASVAYAIRTYMTGYHWLSTLVTIAILMGFSSVILVMLLGQSRVFYTMSTDGLLPKVFSDLHPKFRTPYKSNLILFVFAGLFAAFIPESVAGDLTSFGTLFAFVLVSAGVWVMRRSNPEVERPFKTPLVPLVPILGILVCAGMIIALDVNTLEAAFSWMILGLVVYFAYSKKNSKLRVQNGKLQEAA